MNYDDLSLGQRDLALAVDAAARLAWYARDRAIAKAVAAELRRRITHTPTFWSPEEISLFTAIAQALDPVEPSAPGQG